MLAGLGQSVGPGATQLRVAWGRRGSRGRHQGRTREGQPPASSLPRARAGSRRHQCLKSGVAARGNRQQQGSSTCQALHLVEIQIAVEDTQLVQRCVEIGGATASQSWGNTPSYPAAYAKVEVRAVRDWQAPTSPWSASLPLDRPGLSARFSCAAKGRARVRAADLESPPIPKGLFEACPGRRWRCCRRPLLRPAPTSLPVSS
jgi:hypothetical protein